MNMTGALGKKAKIHKRSSILIAMLFIFALRAGAEEQKKVLIGINAGWSFGSTDVSAGLHYEKAALDFHLGATVQFDLNELFGVQASLSYQNFNNALDTRTSPVESSEYLNTNGGLLTIGVNGVLNSKKANHTQFYLLAGAGISFGELIRYDIGTRLELDAGLGVKYFLTAALRSALDFGLTFHQLLNLSENPSTAGSFGYIRLGVGFEFYPRY
jgi:hypothetical protein